MSEQTEKDREILNTLRDAACTHSPVEVALLLGTLTDLTQFSFITYFTRACPAIPLRVLLDAGGWSRVSAGKLSDADVDRMLSPWIRRSQCHVEFYMPKSVTETMLVAVLERILPELRGQFGTFEEYKAEGTVVGTLLTGFPEGDFVLVNLYFPSAVAPQDEKAICEALSLELKAAIVHSEIAPSPTADNPFLWLLCENGRSYYVLEDRRRDYDGLVLDLTTKKPVS